MLDEDDPPVSFSCSGYRFTPSSAAWSAAASNTALLALIERNASDVSIGDKKMDQQQQLRVPPFVVLMSAINWARGQSHVRKIPAMPDDKNRRRWKSRLIVVKSFHD